MERGRTISQIRWLGHPQYDIGLSAATIVTLLQPSLFLRILAH